MGAGPNLDRTWTEPVLYGKYGISRQEEHEALHQVAGSRNEQGRR